MLEQGQMQFDCLAKAAGCSNATERSPLECLRKANTTALSTTNCQFSPSFDKKIPSALMNAAYTSSLRHTPSIFGTTANEGTDFAPQTLNSTAEFRAAISYLGPFLSPSALDGLVAINAFSHPAFKCPTYAYAGHLSWVYDWVLSDPEDEASGVRAYHTVELHAIWGPNNTDGHPAKSYLPGGVNAGVVPLMRHYVASFVRWLDPNVGRLEGAPRWEKEVGGRSLRIGGWEGWKRLRERDLARGVGC
ncbi:alpha/beta-hydrolase [Karstenula rhodostoma CBS 690.94]|uniref:Alpha/beta-hydrolase n=1 Tax=Karstenula rhodostoma CBS 690.94 TaxID=1392251 RepID=A0A9P4UJ43_9PLEO|nr:alpha/beta-hydrolase [Karstenula rhodostoma CBS 690.94]